MPTNPSPPDAHVSACSGRISTADQGLGSARVRLGCLRYAYAARGLADKYGSVLSKKDTAKAGSFADKRLVEAILSFARRCIRIKRKRRAAEAPRR